MIENDALRLYRQGVSARKIAAHCGISLAKVRKILISAGEYNSPRSDEIALLLEQGLSVKAVARALGISAKTVNAHMPYSKGMYDAASPSENALRIRKCRAKKKGDEDGNT